MTSIFENDIFDTDYLSPPRQLSLKSGEDYSLEEEAAIILAKGREGVTALRDKRDYLTKDQLLLRASKEVLNVNGVAEESLFSGMFRRAHNDMTHRRPGKKRHDEG